MNSPMPFLYGTVPPDTEDINDAEWCMTIRAGHCHLAGSSLESLAEAGCGVIVNGVFHRLTPVANNKMPG